MIENKGKDCIFLTYERMDNLAIIVNCTQSLVFDTMRTLTGSGYSQMFNYKKGYIMVKEKIKAFVNKDNVKKITLSKKYIPWVVAVIFAYIFSNFFFEFNNYCSREEVIDAIDQLADGNGYKIAKKGGKKVARDGKLYYCQIPLSNKEGRTLKYTVHVLDEGFWAELGHNFQR